MSYLLAISIGPVQDFIAASRRTADLSAGSDMLLELCNHVAEGIDGELIFPSRKGEDAANKILAIVADPPTVAEKARLAANDKLREMWDHAVGDRRFAWYLADVRLAESQVAGFLEFAAAWVEHSPQSHGECRARVEDLLAARKNLREFEPPESKPQVPKSPLDPSREAVVRLGEGFGVHAVCRDGAGMLFLKQRETLDAISLLKRYRGKLRDLDASKQKVPSTSEMAARAVEGWRESEVQEELSTAVADDGVLGKRGLSWSDPLFPGRIAAELGNIEEPERRAIQNLATRYWREGLGRSEPFPYYAILLADGDRMGKLISKQDTKEQHQTLSRHLSSFAHTAKEIVESEDGHLIYAGGDDALALLPCTRAIQCAERLREAFDTAMEAAARERQHAIHRPLENGVPLGTLSVGIAIVHAMEPLQDSLENVRAAEKAAKKERNSLAVGYFPRGGAAEIAVTPWSDFGDWAGAESALAAGLSRGVPYELRELADELTRDPLGRHGQNEAPWELIQPETRRKELLLGEAVRILKRKQGGGGVKPPGWVETPAGLRNWASLLLVQRFLVGVNPKVVAPTTPEGVG